MILFGILAIILVVVVCLVPVSDEVEGLCEEEKDPRGSR